eukprot:TRINITY_DN10657_c0_g1_i3.p3 TRINITY_DN10657_c0_g1~~TRINITY_DN10657_c0_g1_i3.p3  ORF type:complete len:140 (-),score=32.55 TRINITY_DN10657_c0_g1_i3:30-449(-)
MQGEVVATMNCPLRPIDKIKAGCMAMHSTYKVPDSDTSVMDKHMMTLTKFLEDTHNTSGDEEPVILLYYWTKKAEPGTTGNTLYHSASVFRRFAGVQGHMEKAAMDQDGFAKVLEISQKYGIPDAAVLMSTVTFASIDS